MKISLYLHRDRADVLETFGEMSDVINRILDEADKGLIDIEDKPACESRDGACRFDVNINNENYLQLLQIYGVKSKRISLRRLVYWFVDNEIYNDLGWEPVNEYVDYYSRRINKYVDDILGELHRFELYCESAGLQHAITLINEAKSYIMECRR